MLQSPEFYALIDQTYQDILEQTPTLPDAWLLQQTILTSTTRRLFLNSLPIQKNWNVLDLGTGFGASAFDFVGGHPVHVQGVDLDGEKIAVAEQVARKLSSAGALTDRTVTFQQGDAYKLSYGDDFFHFAISRFVMQHLKLPLLAIAELHRVVQKGGYVCLVDADDRFSVMYPGANGYEQLMKAFQMLQTIHGGDRFVGRKLPYYLNRNGFEVVGVFVQPAAGFVSGKTQMQSTQMLVEHFERVKPELIENGILTPDEYSIHMEDFRKTIREPQFRANSEIVVLAKKL